MNISQRIKRIVAWFGYTAIAVLLVLITIITVISLTYEKTLIKYLKKYLDEHLLTEIIVDNIDFSLIKKFPSATVEFSNVVIKSRAGLNYSGMENTSADTLLFSKSVYFQFNLIALLRNEYQLKRIQFVEGKTNILTDQSGRKNYVIWKSLATDTSDQSYKIDFKNVLISDFNFYINNLQSSFLCSSFVKKAVFTGLLSNNMSSYSLKANLLMHEARSKQAILFQKLPVLLDFKLSETGGKFLLHDCMISLSKLQLFCTGELLYKPFLQMDLTITSSNFGLNEIMSLVPMKSGNYLNNFAFGGRGNIDARVKGTLTKNIFPGIVTKYHILNGSVTNRKTKSKLSGINIMGSFTGNKLTNFKLILDAFSARLSTGKIQGSCTIQNFPHPQFKAAINSTIDLNNLNHFIQYDSIEIMKGSVNASIKAEGFLDTSKSITFYSFLPCIQSGTLECTDCSFKYKGSDYLFQDINGLVDIGRIITFQDFALTLNQSNFITTGSVENMFNYLCDGKSKVSSNLYIYSKVIDLNGILKKEQENSADSLSVILPNHFSMQAKINADEFMVGKFSAHGMKCNVSYTPKELSIKNFTISFIDGSISGNSLITQQDDSSFLVSCNSELKRIDIQNLFTAFNNFGQNFIVDENLRGKLGGNIAFTASWDSRLNFIAPNLTAQASVEIINGELLKFDPMLSLSKYINVDELKHIKFKTLTNDINIYQKNIYIPEMSIQSTAFNIALSGKHSFENLFDYRLKISLADILFHKAKRKRKEIDDYLVMEQETRQNILPISIIGTPENYVVQLDSKKAFDLIKENLKKERQEIKQAFGNEPGTSVNRINKTNNNSVEWEEIETRHFRIREENSDNSGNEFHIKWDEGDSSDVDFFN